MPGSEWGGVEDIASMRKELLKIRKTGFAEEKRSELAALAIPVLDADGFLVGAIGAYVPLFRFNKEKKDALVDSLKKVSQKITLKIKES